MKLLLFILINLYLILAMQLNTSFAEDKKVFTLTEEQKLKLRNNHELRQKFIEKYVEKYYEGYIKSYLKNVNKTESPFPPQVLEDIKKEILDASEGMEKSEDPQNAKEKINKYLYAVTSKHLTSYLNYSKNPQGNYVAPTPFPKRSREQQDKVFVKETITDNSIPEKIREQTQKIEENEKSTKNEKVNKSNFSNFLDIKYIIGILFIIVIGSNFIKK